MTPQHWKALLPVIQAFANGQKVQCFWNGRWCDAVDLDFKHNPRIYRIKPETIKSRRYLWKHESGLYCVGLTDNFSSPNDPEKWDKFVKWIDEDWVEHELPTSTTTGS